MIYFTSFISSCICIYIYQKLDERYEQGRNTEKKEKRKYSIIISKSKIIRDMFLLLAIFFPAFLGGIRASSIGTDVEVYVKNIWSKACDASNMLELLKNVNIEYGYTAINYIISRFTHDCHIFQFIISFIVVLLMIKGLENFKKDISLCFGMGVFYFVFYLATFNYVRQSIALSLLFWGAMKYINRNYVKFSLVVIVASLFHITALIGFVFLLIHYVAKSKFSGFKKLIVYSALMFVLFGWNSLIVFLINMSLIDSKFIRYLGTGNVSVNPLNIIFQIPAILVLVYIGKKENTDYRASFFSMIIVFAVITSIMNSYAQYVGRLSYYFGYFFAFAIPFSSRKLKPRIGILYTIAMTGLVLLYWYLYYIYFGYCETYPFISDVWKFIN